LLRLVADVLAGNAEFAGVDNTAPCGRDGPRVGRVAKALSTLETIVAEFGDCHRKRRLPNSATVAVFGDKLSPISATIVSSVDRL